jgi:molecular chaperone GrpE
MSQPTHSADPPVNDSLGDAAPSEAAAAPPDPSAEQQARIDALQDQLLRAKAETQNVQRRAALERNEAIRFANAELMRSLIPVLEDFDRTFENADAAAEKSILEGIRLVHANLIKALRDAGLEPIEARGEDFDPAIHEALMHQPTDNAPPGRVIDQVTRGYRLRDRVLRPARVVVAKALDAG